MHQRIFGGFHELTRLRVPVIVAEQVQHAVNDVADQFALARGVESAGLDQCLVQADDDFTVQQSRTDG